MRAVTALVLAAGVGALPLGVRAEEGQRLIAVEVKGARSIARETILAKVQSQPGAPYRPETASEDIRRLFALGYFTDVKTELETLPEGLRLVFVVREKPSIAAIHLDGHRSLAKPKLLELIGLQVGELYDPRRVKEGVDQVKAEYGRKGYSQVEVLARTETDAAANEVTLRVLIDEGPRMRIAGILVEGNAAFPDKRIRKLLKTKRRKWFFPGRYDAQVLEEDLERVRAFYRKHGYQDAAVAREIYQAPDGRGLYVHLTVTEGLQHRVGAVALAGTGRFPEAEVRRTIALKPGAVYSIEGLQEDLRRLKEYYGDRGHIQAQVTPDPQLDPQSKRVNLTYHVAEGPLVHVERIDIRGNLQTKDLVIRRELRLYPGEPFDGAKIRKSVERLRNLGFFEDVTVDTEPTDRPDHEDLIVEVKEAKTGSFSFGGGFSSVDRLIGLIELEQRNFDWRNWPRLTGAGQDLRLRIEAGTVRRYFDLAFTEPWIFGRPVSFGIDLYNRTRLRSQNLGLGYEEERRGLGFRLGREFADTLQTGLSYQFYQTEISDVVEEASADLKAEQGQSNTSVMGLSVGVDRRDNRFDPAAGWFVYQRADLAGGPFGADQDFYRYEAGASGYWPHAGRWVLESRVRGGVVKAYSGTAEVPIFERFFSGGASTIRGFPERKVGPRDPTSNDPIGGEATLVATLEEVLTIITDDRDRPILKGTLFYDVGNVWRRTGDFGESFKSGAGIGVRVTTPIGPMRLDLGFPISDLQGEERKPRFHFNVSRSF
jgi:outer membrane protein insertion porin family